MNAEELARHYKDVFSRTRQATRQVVVIPKKTEAADGQKQRPNPKPDPRVVPRDEKRRVTRELFMKWFVETNQDEHVEVSMPEDARRITQRILDKHGLTMKQAFSRAKVAFAVQCRNEIWFALAANGYGYGHIGRMCKRDHTSIIHGVKKWRDESGRKYSEYVTDPSAVARRLSVCRNYLAKSEARIELDQYLERIGAVAARGDGVHLSEAGEDHVRELV